MSKRGNGEGTFERRPGKRWRYRVLVNGQRIDGYGATKPEAKAQAEARAAIVGERPARDTFAEMYAEWCSLDPSTVGLRPTTRDQYATLVRAHLSSLDGVRLDRLDKRTAAAALRLPSTSPSVRRATYAALVKVLDYAVDAGLVGVNVARQVPRPPAPEARNREVSADDAQAILEQAKGHRYEVAAWLAFGCGLRRGEVLALRWSEVDLKAGTLTVSGNVTRSSAGLQRGATKTRRGRRNVPAPAVVVQALKAHKKRQTTEQLAAGSAWEPTGLVVTTELGGLVEPRTLSRVWQRWAKDAGVTDTGTHTGRHYAASTLLASGAASVADVAAQLGHDPAVLLNTYAVAVAEGQRAASHALGASLRPVGTTRGTTRRATAGTD